MTVYTPKKPGLLLQNGDSKNEQRMMRRAHHLEKMINILIVQSKQEVALKKSLDTEFVNKIKISCPLSSVREIKSKAHFSF